MGSVGVAITGIGVVSPYGVGRDLFWDRISRGISGTRAITEFDKHDFGGRSLTVNEARPMAPRDNSGGFSRGRESRQSRW